MGRRRARFFHCSTENWAETAIRTAQRATEGVAGIRQQRRAQRASQTAVDCTASATTIGCSEQTRSWHAGRRARGIGAQGAARLGTMGTARAVPAKPEPVHATRQRRTTWDGKRLRGNSTTSRSARDSHSLDAADRHLQDVAANYVIAPRTPAPETPTTGAAIRNRQHDLHPAFYPGGLTPRREENSPGGPPTTRAAGPNLQDDLVEAGRWRRPAKNRRVVDMIVGSCTRARCRLGARVVRLRPRNLPAWLTLSSNTRFDPRV